MLPDIQLTEKTDDATTKIVKVSHSDDVAKASSPSRKRLLIGSVLFLVLLLSGAVIGLAVAYVNAATPVGWASTHDKHPNPLHPGLTKPGYVSPDGRNVTQSIHVVHSNSTRQVNLTYQATLTDSALNTIAIDQDETIVRAYCDHGAILHIQYTSVAIAEAQSRTLGNGSLVTGSANWGCTLGHLSPNASTATRTIMYTITSVLGVQGASVTVTVVPASLHDFFGSLHVSYTDSSVSEPDNDTVSSQSGRRLSLWSDMGDALYSAAGSALHAITHPVSTLKKAVKLGEDAAKFGESVLEGDFGSTQDQEYTLAKFSWPQYSSTTQSEGVDFGKSLVNFDAGIKFGLDMESWQLQSAEFVVTADSSVGLDAAFNPSSSNSYDHTFSLMKNKKLGGATFSIGPVPFHANLDFNLELRLKASATSDASIHAGATASASAEMGVRYSSYSGWERVATKNWQDSWTPPSLSASAQATATISVVPTTALVFDWIGGPRGSILPYVAVTAQASTYSGCSGSLGFGVNVGVGAEIDIKDPFDGKELGIKKTWPNSLVYQSGTKPVRAKTRAKTTSEGGEKRVQPKVVVS